MKVHSWSRIHTWIAVLLAAISTAAPSSTRAPREPGATSGSVLGPFRLGERVRNRAHLALRLEFGSRGRPQVLDVTGDWAMTPTDLHDDVVEVQCALASAVVRIDAGTAPAPADAARQRAERELSAALATPFFVSYRGDGAIARVWFPRGPGGVAPAVANLLMTLAGTVQLVRGPAGPAAWVVVESDINGRYTAAYRQTGPGRFAKTKASYLAANPLANAVAADPGGSPAARPAVRPVLRIDRSDSELAVDPRGRLLELHSAERIVFELGSPGLEMTTTAEVELAGGRIAQAPDAIGAFGRARPGLEAHPLEQITGDPQAELARRDRAVLGGASFDELRAELRRLPGDAAADAAARGPLARRFEAAFRLDPAAAARAPAVARDEPPARSKLVVDALSLARTAASQVALAAIARDPATPSRVRGNAIQYIAHQDAPPAEVVGALAALIDDGDPELRQIARLAYGACARSTRRLAPDRAHAIIRDLLGRLDRAMAASERAELVIAIGNTGAVEALPALRRIIEAGPLRERAQAIAALRFIDDPQVDPLLTRTLLSAPEEAVRLAVIGAVRLRDLGPHASAMAGVARSDPSAGVRRAALALLGDRLVSLPALRSVLEDIQRTDPAAQNRADAARDLGR